jgi:surface protein
MSKSTKKISLITLCFVLLFALAFGIATITNPSVFADETANNNNNFDATNWDLEKDDSTSTITLKKFSQFEGTPANIIIPSSITLDGVTYNNVVLGSFEGSNVKTVTIGDKNGYVKSGDGLGDMFNGCKYLTLVDATYFDTSNATLFSGTFLNCPNLSEIKFGDKFTTENAVDISLMFESSPKLKKLDLSKFNTSKVTNMAMMFAGCNLEELNISGFTFDNITAESSMSIFGINPEYATKLLGEEYSKQIYSQPTLDQKISTFATIIKNMFGGEYDEDQCKVIATDMLNTKIAKIIAPTTAIKEGLDLGLPGETAFLNSQTKQETYFLQAGNNVILTPVVAQTGVTLNLSFLVLPLVLIATIFVVSKKNNTYKKAK